MQMTPEDLKDHIAEIDQASDAAVDILLVDLLTIAYPAKANQDN